MANDPNPITRAETAAYFKITQEEFNNVVSLLRTGVEKMSTDIKASVEAFNAFRLAAASLGKDAGQLYDSIDPLGKNFTELTKILGKTSAESRRAMLEGTKSFLESKIATGEEGLKEIEEEKKEKDKKADVKDKKADVKDKKADVKEVSPLAPILAEVNKQLKLMDYYAGKMGKGEQMKMGWTVGREKAMEKEKDTPPFLAQIGEVLGGLSGKASLFMTKLMTVAGAFAAIGKVLTTVLESLAESQRTAAHATRLGIVSMHEFARLPALIEFAMSTQGIAESLMNYSEMKDAFTTVLKSGALGFVDTRREMDRLSLSMGKGQDSVANAVQSIIPTVIGGLTRFVMAGKTFGMTAEQSAEMFSKFQTVTENFYTGEYRDILDQMTVVRTRTSVGFDTFANTLIEIGKDTRWFNSDLVKTGNALSGLSLALDELGARSGWTANQVETMFKAMIGMDKAVSSELYLAATRPAGIAGPEELGLAMAEYFKALETPFGRLGVALDMVAEQTGIHEFETSEAQAGLLAKTGLFGAPSAEAFAAIQALLKLKAEAGDLTKLRTPEDVRAALGEEGFKEYQALQRALAIELDPLKIIQNLLERIVRFITAFATSAIWGISSAQFEKLGVDIKEAQRGISAEESLKEGRGGRPYIFTR